MRDHEAADRIVAHYTAGVANDMRVADQAEVGQERSIVVSCQFAGDQIPGMPTKPGKALMRSIQLRTLA